MNLSTHSWNFVVESFIAQDYQKRKKKEKKIKDKQAKKSPTTTIAIRKLAI